MNHQEIKSGLSKAQELRATGGCYSELLDLLAWSKTIRCPSVFLEGQELGDFESLISVLNDALCAASFREYLMIGHRFHGEYSGVISDDVLRPGIMRRRRLKAKRALKKSLKPQRTSPCVPRPLSEGPNRAAFAPRCPLRLQEWSDFAPRMSQMLARVNAATAESGCPLPVPAAITRAKTVCESQQEFYDVELFENFQAATVFAAIDDLLATLGKNQECAQLLPVEHRLKASMNTCNGYEELEQWLPQNATGLYSVHRDMPSEEVLSQSAVFMAHNFSCHQLPVAYLREGLRDMDLVDEVVGYSPAEWVSWKAPLGEAHKEAFKHNSALLVTSALMPLYNAMIRNGLEYGYLATTEAVVFLHIDWDCPEVLHYHLAEPQVEVEKTGDAARSALGQTFLFSLMALESSAVNADYRDVTVAMMPRWDVHYEDVCTLMSRDCRDGDYALPAFPAKLKPSPVVEQWPEYPSIRMPAAQPDVCATERAYCSTKCMRTLRDGKPMDPACPNYRLHVAGGAEDAMEVDSVHPLSLGMFRDKLREQLSDTLADGMIEMPYQRGSGVLFQVTLLGYGYTFIGKGMPTELHEALQKEQEAYERMAIVQGSVVPYVLDTVDLRTFGRTYYQQHSAALVHFSFMTYPGDVIGTEASQDSGLRTQVYTAVMTLWAFGMLCDSIVRENIRVDDDGNVVLFNVEFSEVLDMDSRETWELETASAESRERYSYLQKVLRHDT